MPRNREFDAAALRRPRDEKKSSFPPTSGRDELAVPDERTHPCDLEAGDVRVSDSVTGMMIAAISGAVVGLLAAGGSACAALVFVAAVVGVYAGWQARGDA
jgi:hypothetical protein